MLVFKEVKDDKLVKDFLVNENNSHKDLSSCLIFGGFEDDNIFGLCIIDIDAKEGKLENLIIKEEYRGDNLGNGLLRSTLNKLDKMGINYVTYPYNDNYLLKFGFTRADENIIHIRLPDFFNKSCGTCGRKE